MPEEDAAENGTAPKIRIEIDFNPATGEIGVAGPIENLTLFLGLLETAKTVALDARADARAKARTSIIPGTTPFNPNMLKRH